MIGDEQGPDLCPFRRRPEQALHEVVIGIRLVDEATARRRDGNDARFGAVDEVREEPDRAVAARHPRDGCPGGGIGIVGDNGGADTLGQPQTVPSVAGGAGGGGIVLLAGRRMRIERLAAFGVAREAAARQHDAAAGMDLDRTVRVDHVPPRSRGPSRTMRSRRPLDVRMGMPRSRADFARRPIRALPLVRRMARPCRARSRA